MSTLLYIGIVIAAIVGLGAGFKLGTHRAHKNRDPRDEDPRDQAIRELRSEINIAKRSVEVAKTTESKAVEELSGNRDEIKKLTASLHDIEQKYTMTKDILKKESSEKEQLVDTNTAQRIETDTLRSQVHELEMQVNMNSAPDMLAGNQNDELEAAETQINALNEEINLLRSAGSSDEQTAVLHKVAAQNSALKSKVQALEADLATAEQMSVSNPEVKRLEQEVQQLQLQIAAADDAKSKLQTAEATLASNQQELQTLREELVSGKTAAARVTELEKEVTEWREKSGRLSELENECRSLESANTELTAQLEAARTETERNAGVQQQLNEAELEKQTLRSEISTLQANADMAGQLQQQVAVLEEEKQTLSKSVHRLQIIAKAAEKLKAELERLRAFASESEKSRKELTRLYQQHRTEKDEHAKLEATLREKMDADRGQIERLETQAAETDAKLQTAIHENEQRERELNQLKSSERELTELSENQQSQLNELRNKQEADAGLTAELEAKVEDQTKLKDQLTGELDAARSEITALKLDTEQAALQAEELNRLREELEQAEAERNELPGTQELLRQTREQLENKATEILKLEETLDTALADAESAQSTATKLQEKIDQWESERDELNSQTQQIQDTAATSMRISNEMVNRLQKSSAECDHLRQQNAELETTALAAVEESDALRYQIIELEESANAVHNERADVVERLRAAIADNEKLKHQLQDLQDLKNDNGRLRNTLSSMNSAMQEMQTDSSSPDAESPLEKTMTFVHDGVSRPHLVHNQTDDSGDDDTGALPVIESASENAEATDDLRSIKGVGEVLENKLKQLGILSFQDVIDLGPEDFERATALIPNLESRWQRDDWQQQAAKLQSEKHNA